jgi:hypothetical protein
MPAEFTAFIRAERQRIARVGQQVGICEGRPDSKNSAGMGWGLFDIEKTTEEPNGKR